MLWDHFLLRKEEEYRKPDERPKRGAEAGHHAQAKRDANGHHGAFPNRREESAHGGSGDECRGVKNRLHLGLLLRVIRHVGNCFFQEA